MADRIRVDTDQIDRWASELGSVADALSQAGSMLSQVNTGDEWWRKVHIDRQYKMRDIEGSVSIGDARHAVSALRTTLGTYQDRVTGLSGAVRNAATLFDDTERQIGELPQNTGTEAGEGDGMFRIGDLIGSIHPLISPLMPMIPAAWKYFDIKDLLDNINIGDWLDFADQLENFTDKMLPLYHALKSGLLTSGFDVVRNGDYAIIKGGIWARKGIENYEQIKSTRYKVGSDAYNNSFIAAFDKAAPIGQRIKAAFGLNFQNFGKDTFSLTNAAGKTNWGAVIGYATTAYDVITHAVGNYQSGASASKIAADVTVDAAKGVGKMAAVSAGAKAGAAIGTLIPIPVVGNVVGGFIGGAAAGFIYDGVTGWEIGGKTVTEHVSTGVEYVYSAAGEVISDVGQAVGDAAKSAGKAIGNFIDDAGDWFSMAVFGR